ncbi:winged helix-turn-helix domain-containing protein [Vibrio hyugaensis]|uniref:winged helix-turn-helix domain-containing protein n=1 Tax=Vibrio hyugaensis TaxID=1534743 RepID=UPI000CE49200|nr:helix-turn-helix domain-containing protein [Vibrio hyugaensis]
MYERLSIDTVRRTITLVDSESGKENQLLELNRSEYNLLLAFCDSHGEVIEKQTLIELGWPGRVVGDNSLAVAIMKLRKKLDSLELEFEINNLPSEGYVFINAKNIAIDYECSLQEVVTHGVNKRNFTEKQGVIDDKINNKSELREFKFKHSGIKKLIFESLFWEVLLGVIIGAVVFFFIYREAFECFECFGGGGG